MRKCLVFLLFLGCASGGRLLSSGSYEAGGVAKKVVLPAKLTLDMAEKIAMENAPSVLRARFGLERARGGLKEARSSMFPTISATYGYWQRDPRQGIKVDMSQFGVPNMGQFGAPGTMKMYMGERGYAFFRAEGSMALWTFGARRSAIRAAEADVAAAGFDEEAAKQEAVRNVRKAFFGALMAQQAVEVAQKAVQALRERLCQVKALYEAGVATEYDLRSAESALADAESGLTKAREGARVAKVALAAAMGLPPGEFTLVMPTFSLPESLNAEELATQAFASNPTLAAMTRRLLALKHRRNAVYASFFPQLVVTGGYNWADDDTLIDKGYGEVRVMLTWEMFAGGRTAAQLRQMDAAIGEMRQAIREARNGVRLGVYDACSRYMSARKELEAAREGLQKAELALRQKEAEFEEGVATGADVVAAEVGVSQARLRLIKARLAMAEALADLEALVGRTIWRISN